MINKKIKSISVLGLAFVIVGCSTKTESIDSGERKQRVQADQTGLYAGQEAIAGSVTLGEAIARSLKYNLDHKLRQMETAVSVRQYEFEKHGLLPRIVANAGYSIRNNDPGASSINLETGEESLPDSTSQERQVETADISLTWNVLDFGLSYYTAKQNNDQIFIAEERRRKTVQNITQDVIDAFWKAWIAQTLSPKVEALLAETRAALAESRQLVSRGVQNSSDALRSQGDLLGTINTLIEIRERIDLSRVRLAALINVAPGSEYELSAPTVLDSPAEIAQSYDQLTNIALLNRPELREEDYRKRISQLDVKKAFLRYYPNLNIFASLNRDQNDFLVNNSFNTIGWGITWDLLGILQARSEKRFREAQVDVADARRLALSMAVTTQVYLSAIRYELALERYKAASELFEIRKNLEKNSSIRGARVSGLDTLNARSAAIASELRRSLAFSETQTAFARVVNSIGVDPVPDAVGSHDLKALSAEFDKRWASMTKGVLSDF